MPLVRVEVRSEYGLGAPELYTEADKEDPKAVLEGVAVAGLVGILRQLGDLAEFAAEVFHGLQEQVMITSSRSQKLTRRVQRIEAALPRLEKLVLAQRSHVHFAYTSGANWHSRIRCEHSHFIYSDLPRFIMDSYEYCRRPPHLDLLDKFDAGGRGSCLKRYSDPSFFKRASSGSYGAYIDKIIKEKKGRKIKKKRSSLKTGAVLRGASFSNTSSRLQSTSQSIDGQTPPFQTFSNYGAPKSDLGDQTISLGSRYWSGDLEDLSRPSYSMNDEEQTYNGSSFSPARMHHSDSNSFVSVNGKAAVMDETQSILSGEQTGPSSFCVTWDGKTEILELAGAEYDHDETFGTISMNFDLVNEERGAINFGTPKKNDHDENVETISTNFLGESERGASHLNTSKEYDYDDTAETCPTNFNIETERGTSHFKTANDYDQDDNLDTPAGNVGGVTEERGIIHFKTAKEHDYADTLEIHSIKFDGGTEGRASSHLGAAKKCDNDATSEARMINFNIETEESKSSHFRAAGGYYQDENLGTLSGNLDGEIEETIVIHFKTAKEHDYADTLETCLMNFDVETEDKESKHPRAAKGYNHDANLEVLSANFDTTEQGATHFEVAKEYNYADTSETHLTDFDLETENRGTSHLKAAKEYDHDETLETPSLTFDLETQDEDDVHLKTAGKMDIHQDNKEFSMPVPDDILFGGRKVESVGQMNAQLGNEDVPIPTPSDLQGATHFKVAKEYNYANTSETHLTDFDLETENRGTSHLRAAKEYDHDETLDTPSVTFDLETQDEDDVHLKTAGKMDIHQDNKEFSMLVPDDILFGGCKSESVGQMNAQLGNEDVPIPTPSDLQGATHFKVAKEYNYADTSETHLTDFDLETENRGTSHLRAAKEYDHDETLKTPSVTFDLETQDEDDIHLKTAGKMDIHQDNKEFSMLVPDDILFGGCKSESVGQMNVQLGNEDVPILTPSDLERDDIESETDNYVDALNTIESECETDVDGPNKQEVEQYSDSDNKAVDVGLDMLTTRHSGSHSSNSMSLSNCTSSSSLSDGVVGNDPYPLLPGTFSGDRVSSEGILNSVPFESCALEHSPPMASKPLSSGSQPNVNSCEIGDVLGRSNATSVTSNVSSDSKQQSLGVQVNDKSTSSFSEVQKPSPEPSTVTEVKIWTNGGLLGLQPSKPPDFSTLNVSNEVKKSTDDKIGTSRLKSDITERTSRSVDEETVTECSASCQDEKRGGSLVKKASWLFSSADLGVNLQKLSDSYNQRYSDNSQKNGRSETCGTVLPVSPDIASTRGSQEKSSNSSRMFELGNKLLMNGFYRKPSFEKDDNFYATSSPTAVVLDLKNRNQNVDNQTFSGRSKGMLRSVSPLMSPSSSPPLGHMKISFQPIRGLEDHKLQLKFPDGGVSHESGRDMFPTFQLVPEPGVPLHDVGSDSEDDTFCRSSPYGSDCPSHQSDSNSEQWESSESTSSKDHELYDALRRISFSESVPASGDTGAAVQGEVRKNIISQIPIASSVEHSQSSNLFDLPSLDTLDPTFMERNECDLNSNTEAQCYKEPNPSPPPLPPPEWRAMKTQAEWADNRQVIISENLSYGFDCKFGSTISQQPKPAPLKQEQITEGAHLLKSEYMQQPDLQKTGGHKEVDQAVFQKEIEEKEDFLHQIRTKSFNLRRTVTSKPTATTVSPTSTQVTAILKKANEIRQAVGSDGEDDTWSDT